jgi:branched-chain amino acid transport system permease protein
MSTERWLPWRTHSGDTWPRGLSTAVERLRPGQRRWLIVAVVVGLLALPLVIRSDYALRILDMVLIWSILALGQNVITGYCGQLSLGQAAFYGIGAYTSALITMRLGAPYPVALLAAVGAATLLGIIVGIPSIRIGGDYLFIVTIGFAEIVRLVFLNWTSVTNGPKGLVGVPVANILGYALHTNRDYYYLLIALLVAIMLGLHLVLSSDIGRAFQAIREDETAAQAMGIDISRYKVLAFALGAGTAGVAGSVLAHFLAFVGPDNFTMLESSLAFEIVILGGLGSLPGSVLGALLIVGSTEWLRWLQEYRLYIGGLVLMLVMLVRPQGLIGTVRLRPPRPPAGDQPAEEVPGQQPDAIGTPAGSGGGMHPAASTTEHTGRWPLFTRFATATALDQRRASNTSGSAPGPTWGGSA